MNINKIVLDSSFVIGYIEVGFLIILTNLNMSMEHILDWVRFY
jgi:hypothetical protein